MVHVVFSSLLALKNYLNCCWFEPPLVRSIFLLLCQPQLTLQQKLYERPDKVNSIYWCQAKNGLMQTLGSNLKCTFNLINKFSYYSATKLLKKTFWLWGFMLMIAHSTRNRFNPNDFHYSLNYFRSDSFHILHPKLCFLKARLLKGRFRQVNGKIATLKKWSSCKIVLAKWTVLTD